MRAVIARARHLARTARYDSHLMVAREVLCELSQHVRRAVRIGREVLIDEDDSHASGGSRPSSRPDVSEQELDPLVRHTPICLIRRYPVPTAADHRLDASGHPLRISYPAE